MNFVCTECMQHFSLAGKVALKYDFISLCCGSHSCFLSTIESNKQFIRTEIISSIYVTKEQISTRPDIDVCSS